MCSELVLGAKLFGIPDDRAMARAEVARHVDAVFSGPDPEAAIFEALSASVSAARYWQDPDEPDVLLADPTVSLLFLPVAEAVVRHASTRWWSTGVDMASQVHTMDGWTTRPRVFGAPAADALRELRVATIKENDGMREHRRKGGEERWSMTSGTWWSPPIGAVPGTARNHRRFGPLDLSLEEDAPGRDEARSWPVTLPVVVRVLEVDSATAWADLVRRYPVDVTFARGANWLQATGRDDAWAIPDWHAVSGDYDAIHLTVAGYLSASGKVIDIDTETASFIAAWGPDKTYWLTDIGIRADRASRWARNSDDLWQPVD
jgi:hypothetical protein